VVPAGLFTTKPNEILADRPYSMENETLVVAATVNWEISDSLAMKSITSYVDHKSNAEVDSDATLVDINFVPSFHGGFARPSESWGQEFNLVGKSERVSWLLGAFLYNEKSGNSLPVSLGPAGVAGTPLPPGTTIFMPTESETDSWAIYGDATISVTDRLRLNLGLRYNKEKQDFVQTWGLVIPAGNQVINVVAPSSIDLDDDNDKLLPRIGFQYDVTSNTNAYIQWSKGYKSGGVNIAGGGNENRGQLYKPEGIDAFEAGLKSQLLDGAVTWNSAAFYYDYQDMQVTRNAPPAVTVVDNSDAEVYGFESELWWSVTDDFRLNAAVILLHSRFKDYVAFNSVAGTFDDLDGTAVPHAPDYTVTIGGDYTVNLGGNLLNSLTISGNVYRTDDVVLRQFAGPENRQKAYTLTNLSATLADADESLRLTVFVNNLGDKEYKQHVLHFGLGYMGNYGPPRTWGVKLSKAF
jgi:iron complex outermembrane recepter protein